MLKELTNPQLSLIETLHIRALETAKKLRPLSFNEGKRILFLLVGDIY